MYFICCIPKSLNHSFPNFYFIFKIFQMYGCFACIYVQSPRKGEDSVASPRQALQTIVSCMGYWGVKPGHLEEQLVF